MCLGEAFEEKKRAIQQFSGVDEQGSMSQIRALFYLIVHMELSACSGLSVSLRLSQQASANTAKAGGVANIEEEIAFRFKALSVNSRNIVGLDISMCKESTKFLYFVLYSHLKVLAYSYGLNEEPLACTLNAVGRGSVTGMGREEEI